MSAIIFFATESTSGSGGGSLDTALLLLASSGFTGLIVAVITAIVNRKKLKAEETSIITQAAGGVVTRLQEENIRVIKERDEARARVEDLKLAASKKQEHIDELKDQIDAHIDYDMVLVSRLIELGEDVEPPPPIIIQR